MNVDANANPKQNGPLSGSKPEISPSNLSPDQIAEYTKKEGSSKSLAASLGFVTWPHSDDALINALRVKAEHERTKQEFFRFESNKRVLEILEHATKMGIPANLIPLLFSGHDESAELAVAQLLGKTQLTSPRQADRQKSTIQSQNPEQQQRSQRQQIQQPTPSNVQLKSPRTPMRPGELVSPSTLGQSQNTLPSVAEAPSSGFFTPSGQQTRIMEPRSQPSAQHHHSLSFDSNHGSPDRFIPGHRPTMSALPSYGTLGPSVFPAGSAPARPVVTGGFYPAHLIPPRLPNIQQPSATSPGQPSQPMGLQMPLPLPVATSSPFPGTVPVSLVQPQSPSQYQQPPQVTAHQVPQQAQQPQQQNTQQQPQQQPQQPHVSVLPAPVHPGGQSAVASGSPSHAAPVHHPPQRQQQQLSSQPATYASDGSSESGNRPLIPVMNSSLRPIRRKGGGHQHSLSTGSDLRIHQWRPKELLRDNRWKISNPFSKLKERKGDTAHAGVHTPTNTSADKPGSNNLGNDSVDIPRTSNDTPAAKRLSAGVRPSVDMQSPPPVPPIGASSSATVVAAHNNKRRSMTHSRQRSRASISAGPSSPYRPADDARRHSEGVAVLASLAWEQDRRDRGDVISSKTGTPGPIMNSSPSSSSSSSSSRVNSAASILPSSVTDDQGVQRAPENSEK